MEEDSWWRNVEPFLIHKTHNDLIQRRISRLGNLGTSLWICKYLELLEHLMAQKGNTFLHQNPPQNWKHNLLHPSIIFFWIWQMGWKRYNLPGFSCQSLHNIGKMKVVNTILNSNYEIPIPIPICGLCAILIQNLPTA